MSNHDGTQHKDHIWLHVISWAIMIALTLVAFIAVGTEAAAPSVLIPLILVLAVIQVVLQVYVFMHLNNKNYLFPGVFLGVGLLIAVIIVLSLWDLIWLK